MGAGAIGGTLAAYLSRAGRDVTVIDAWPAHIDKIKTNGLTVTTMEGTFTAHPEALHIGELSATTNRYDVVFVSVKSLRHGLGDDARRAALGARRGDRFGAERH